MPSMEETPTFEFQLLHFSSPPQFPELSAEGLDYFSFSPHTCYKEHLGIPYMLLQALSIHTNHLEYPTIMEITYLMFLMGMSSSFPHSIQSPHNTVLYSL